MTTLSSSVSFPVKLQKLLLIYLGILMLCVASCKSPAEETVLRNTSLFSGFEKAGTSNKGLILVSNKSGCSMCELFEVDLMKDQDYAQHIYKDFVIQRIDENATGSKWLSRILNRGSFPIFLFFDTERKLIGIEMGTVKKPQMEKLLEKVRKKEVWVDHYYQPGAESKMQSSRLLQYVGGLIESQYFWDQYGRNKDSAALTAMPEPLNRSLSAYPSFYNRYLLAKYYNTVKDDQKARETALAALAVEDPSALYFNSGLRTEMKMLVDANYNVYSDAYIGLSDTEQQLGKIKFGEQKTVDFSIKNIGKQDLILNKIITDCDCTVADYPKTAIKPGTNGIIHVNFTAKRSGEFTHMLEIGANASNAPLQLTIKGLVLGD